MLKNYCRAPLGLGKNKDIIGSILKYQPKFQLYINAKYVTL